MPKTTNVAAELLDGEEKLARARQKPGAFWYYDSDDEKDVGIIHSCPCGCGIVSSIYLKPHGGKASPMWKATGPRDKPTLSPSVGIHAYNDPENPRRNTSEKDGFHWHGYLRAGVWQSV